MKVSFSRFLVFLVAAILLITTTAFAQVVEIPDPNLEQAIRDQLNLEFLAVPPDEPITQQDMLQLTELDEELREINDLTGLEFATNLRKLALNQNQITDLSPLSNLIHLQNLAAWGNPISDISPLSNLTKLIHLRLTRNQIVDISPLANLTQLKYLSADGNRIKDFSPLDGLSLIRLVHDEACELPALPIQQRIKNRTFPSIFAAWVDIVLNRPQLSDEEHLALHDLHWTGPHSDIDFLETSEGWQLNGTPEKAQAFFRDSLLALNPNMLFLAEVRFRDVGIGLVFPEDFPYWLRDTNGNRIETSPGSNVFLFDFMRPGMQDTVVQHVIAVAKCGLYDGIFFDWFAESGTVLPGYYNYEEEQRVKDTILQRIRAAVRDDFLIIINTNRSKMPRRAWGINGTFMETLQDDFKTGYTRAGIIEIEDTLLWSEENLRAPQINCLEGWGIPTEPPDSPNNLRWMRVFTTMSLTCSDGYVLYATGTRNPDHLHFWYDFWDAELGYPIGPKAQHHQNIEGLFVREFTNGWAVYNRSGNAQTITLPASAIPVSDRGNNAASVTHLLPDLDGEIYLKAKNPADVNGDGNVNILDLV